MPGSVIAAVVGSAVSGWVGGGLLGTIIGGIASQATSAVFSAVFNDEDKGAAPAARFEQDAAGRVISFRQPVTHWQVVYGRTRVGGPITFMEVVSDGTPNNTLLLVVTLACHAVEEIEAVWFDDEEVPLSGGSATGRYAGYVYIEKSLGNEGGAQPFPTLVGFSKGKWTNAHLQQGHAKLFVKLQWNADLFPAGIPNITAVVKGRKVLDPRDGDTQYSNLADLCIADYLWNTEYGLAATYTSEIDTTQLAVAANIDDEDVNLAAGGTEDRYTINGAFSVDSPPREIIGRLLSATAGRVRYIGGVWRLEPAAYATPTISLDEDDLRGVPTIEPRLSAADLANAVKGVFVGEVNNWQPSDFPPVVNATYLSEDQDERSWRELDLPFTSSAATCQRIAKIELERMRQQITVEWPGKASCYRLQPGDTVQISLTMMGWSAKVFEVVESGLVFDADGAVGCDLLLRETASSVFDWSSGEETQVDTAPDTGLPDPFTTIAPGAPSVSETIYETAQDRRVAAKATVSWSGADSRTDLYELQYRAVGDTDWIVLPRTAATSLDLLDLAAGRYEFRVKAVSGIGVSSSWSPTTTAEILALSARPATPVIRGLQASGDGTSAILTLEPHAELDVRRGGRWRIRHYEGDSPDPTLAWALSFSIGDAEGYSGDQTIITLPLKGGSYLVKAEDSGGQQSAAFAYLVVKQASVLAFSLVNSITEDTAFTGTKTGMAAVDGVLKIEGAGLIDDIPDLDTISSLDDYGGVEASGTYDFANRFDFGAVTGVRITGTIAGATINVNDLIDDRTESIDSWLDFDGDAGGGSTDAWLEMRETDDDPAGSPAAWSDWKRLDTAAVEARGVELRLRAISSDPAYNVQINQLRAVAEEVV